jgi:16S rRNA (cytosine1402-N4)-methyltransferase
MHTPVLLHEVLEALRLKEGETFLDGTLGSGGHSAAVISTYHDKVKIIGLDRDQDAIRRSEERLRTLGSNFSLVRESFRNMDKVLEDLDIENVDAILLDIGISSDQLAASGRGFSFQQDEPLLMTMQESTDENELTAQEIVNTFDTGALELILRGFGEEKFSQRIAEEIVRSREVKPFETTFDLVSAIERAVPASYKNGRRINPSTKTFQALRIAVNEELIALEEGLEKGFSLLAQEGRFAVISFHSLEDRIVKNFFRDKAKSGEAKLITKKPIAPSEEEVEANPRSRSAKLRVIEKI